MVGPARFFCGLAINTTMTNRHTFLEFLKRRAPKYQGFGDSSLKCENILNKNVVLLESLGQQLAPLDGIPHAIIGGHAVVFHGHPRTTQDIDVLVTNQHLEAAAQALQLQNQRPIQIIGGIAGTLPDGTEIDLVSPDEPWVNDAVASAVNSPHGKMVSKPFLVLLKLRASRGAQDDTDMLYTLKNMTDEEIDVARQVVAEYLPNDTEDLESMIMMKDYA